MFVITLENNGTPYFLRSTIWTDVRDRATVFASEVEARAALDKAKKFMKVTMYKKARTIAA